MFQDFEVLLPLGSVPIEQDIEGHPLLDVIAATLGVDHEIFRLVASLSAGLGELGDILAIVL